jgi:hypothetical protein
MTAQRLAQLEGAAAPRAVILRWLEEAHAFATLPHYVQWLLGQPPDRWPLALLPGQAAAHVRRAMRSLPELEIVRAIGPAVAETFFLVELVLLLNAVTDDRQREAALRCRLRVADLGILEAEPDAPDTSGPHATEDGTSIAERVEAWRRAVSSDAKEVACAEQARRLLEQRYLDGRPALFPRAAEKWEVTRDAVIENAHLAADFLGPAEAAHDDGADAAAAMAQASQLAEMARAATLGLMGDSSGARAVTARRLRKAEPSANAMTAQRRRGRA